MVYLKFANLLFVFYLLGNKKYILPEKIEIFAIYHYKAKQTKIHIIKISNHTLYINLCNNVHATCLIILLVFNI